MTQFHTEAGFMDESEARFASRSAAIDLVNTLRARGYSRFEAPPKPSEPDLIWDEFASCRILIKWIPPSAYSRWANQYALRVDVLAD